jgi:tetratricopeptide (TPR) repeat protein
MPMGHDANQRGGSRRWIVMDYVLDLDPELSDARVDRANVRLELCDLDGAQEDADAGLAIDPEHAELHALHGMIAHQLGRREEAHRSFAAALRFDPTLAPALSNRATLWFEQGEIDRAIEDLTPALEIDDDPDIRANRALAYEAAGQSQLAASDRAHAAARAARLAAERDSMAPAA